MRTLARWLGVVLVAGCGGSVDGGLPAEDLGDADPTATRPGPVGRPGSPAGAPGAYASGERVDLGGADVILAGPDFTQAGTTVAMPGDMDGDGLADIAISNTGWLDGGSWIRHALHLVYGAADLDPERLLDEAETTLMTEWLPFFGGDDPTLASAGDIDGDGLADLLAGVTGIEGEAGHVYIVYGSATRQLGEHLLEDVAVELADDVSHGVFGNRLTGVGDMNGDGRDEFVVASLGAAGGSRVHLYYGTSARLRDGATADASFDLPIEETANFVAPVGNVDRDQFDDFLVHSELGGRGPQRVRLVRGANVRWSGPLPIDDASARFEVDDAVMGLGGAGDTDGDGFDDFAIATYDAARAYLFFGDYPRWRDPFGVADAAASFVEPEPVGVREIVRAGDVNGDGHADFLISRPNAQEQRGAVHLVMGDGTRRMGSVDLAAATVTFLGREVIDAEHVGEVHDYAGSSLGAGHDVNGDGLDDFIIGAPGDAIGDRTGGRAYLIFGIAEP